MKLETRLAKASNYHTWLAIANEVDRLRGKESWKSETKTQLYDWSLIATRKTKLRVARYAQDIATMKLLIRSGLLRNLGNITDPRLYSQSYTGTKSLIEEYLLEVVTTIQALYDLPTESPHQKLELFSEVGQSFGHSCLVLDGGGTFGLYHLGVVKGYLIRTLTLKALFEADCLPRIISGSSVGALVAALVCTRPNEQLAMLFKPNGVNLKAFTVHKHGNSFQRKIVRLLTEGVLLDIKVLEDCVKDNLKDITFETKMILSITVQSSRKNEIPGVLNHLTAPNVLIRSAACASMAIGSFLFKSVDLLAKDKAGNVFVWSPSSVKWATHSPQSTSEAPELRLAELFNVNHFIASQSQPYLAGDKSSVISRILRFTMTEINFRASQLAQFGIQFPFKNFLLSRTQPLDGNINIAPPMNDTDFFTIFNTPTHDSLSYWILKGEQSTWPLIHIIKASTEVERRLNKVRGLLGKVVVFSDFNKEAGLFGESNALTLSDRISSIVS